MGLFIYNIAVRLYGFFIWLASFTNEKAQKRKEGLSNQNDLLKSIKSNSKPIIWMHVSSLGEYEQGLPLLAHLNSEYKTHNIILSFFSPSGYENVESGPYDYKLYLPIDTAAKMTEFISSIHPSLVILVKYELWYNMLNILSKRNIKVLFISASIQSHHWFLSKLGNFMLQQLNQLDQIFTLNEVGYNLLKKSRLDNITLGGDTRVDRVLANSRKEIDFRSIIKLFNGAIDIVCGSTWNEDVRILAPMINNQKLKIIIAPHVPNETNISFIENHFNGKTIRYSKLLKYWPETELNILIIDSIGLLSSLYRLGNTAYIGGGFNQGIHNILEPTAYGKPIMFGPRYAKFQEAIDLIEIGAAKSVNNTKELRASFDHLIVDQEKIQLYLSNYLKQSSGATDKIKNYIRENKIL